MIEFGKLQRLKGVNYYVLSPYEQKPFKGVLNPGFFNTIKRFRENLFYIGVPVLVAYVMYDMMNKTYYNSKRKNPDDYKDDV